MLTGFFGPRFLLDEDSTGDGGGGGNTTTSDAEKLASLEKKLAALESTNERLLKQSQEHKEAKNKMKEELEAVEKKRLEKDGDTAGLLLKEKERSVELEGKIKSLTSGLVSEKIKSAVAKAAPDANDVDLVLAAGDRDLLQVDSATMTILNTKSFVDGVRKSHPFLFKSAGKDPYGGFPPKGGGTPPLPPADGGQTNPFILEMEKVTTPAERDAVLKKYGRAGVV